MGTKETPMIAVIATDGFEFSELMEPLKAFQEKGILYDVISTHPGVIHGWTDDDWSSEVLVDKTFSDVVSQDYSALFIPGGTLNCDKLRMDAEAVSFVREFFEQSKPIAAICHGPQLLIEANMVRDRSLTSYRSIRSDLENAGARWTDSAVVADRGLITSRSPEDLPIFIPKMIETFLQREHVGQSV